MLPQHQPWSFYFKVKLFTKNQQFCNNCQTPFLTDVQTVSASFETSRSQKHIVQRFYTGDTICQLFFAKRLCDSCYSAYITFLTMAKFQTFQTFKSYEYSLYEIFTFNVFSGLQETPIAVHPSLAGCFIICLFAHHHPHHYHHPRVCIGRTSGLVCDGVSDCIFGEDEAPELCHNSPPQTSTPERR